MFYHAPARWKETGRFEEDKLDSPSKLVGPNHSETIQATLALAATYHKKGYWRQAAALQLEVLDIRRETLEWKHCDTISIASQLVLMYNAHGLSKEALELWQEVVDARLELLGPSHRDTWLAMKSLSWTLYHLQRFTEAKQFAITAKGMQELTNDTDHDIYLSTCKILKLLSEKI